MLLWIQFNIYNALKRSSNLFSGFRESSYGARRPKEEGELAAEQTRRKVK